MGLNYRIEYQPEIVGENGTTTDLGNFSDDDQLIQIREGINPDLEMRTLVHEVIHMMLHSSGAALTERAEEKLAMYFEKVLPAHMRDNPSFWRYVTRRVKLKE